MVVEKVGGGHSTRAAGHHVVSNRLLQVSGSPPQPYKYPPYGGNEKTHTPHFGRFHLQSSHS
jgi:hypothetical protein